jgi:hypothetical protein
VWAQGRQLGFVPEKRPGLLGRLWAMGYGAALFVRSQFARSQSRLEKIYIAELGLDGEGGGAAPTADESPASASP